MIILNFKLLKTKREIVYGLIHSILSMRSVPHNPLMYNPPFNKITDKAYIDEKDICFILSILDNYYTESAKSKTGSEVYKSVLDLIRVESEFKRVLDNVVSFRKDNEFNIIVSDYNKDLVVDTLIEFPFHITDKVKINITLDLKTNTINFLD